MIVSVRRQGPYPARSCIWASRGVAATQIQVDTADITAVVAHVGGRKLVVVALKYIEKGIRPHSSQSKAC